MRISFISILFCFLLSPLVGQNDYITYRKLSSKDKELYKKASKYADELEYNKAFKEINKLLQSQPTFLAGKIKKAGWYSQVNQNERAIEIFQEIIESHPAYNPKIYSTVARMHEKQNEYAEAINYFEKYIELIDSTDETFTRANKEIIKLKFIKEAKDNPVPYEPIRLSDAINSMNSEYLASFTVDGKSMVFTRRIGQQEDFFISHKLDSVFSKAEPLQSLNSRHNEGAHTLSSDGNTIIYTICNATYTFGSCDLFSAVQKEEGWSKPINLGKVINTPAWDAQPALSGDGMTLYFSSKRKGGYGGSDIWVSKKNKDGLWDSPQNAGPLVNTPANEESPFIHVDNHTLYFRSDGHPGMGNFDIFCARKEFKSEKFDTVFNIGYPINTKNDEGALSVSTDGKWAYFASDQSAIGLNPNLDIFKFELPENAKPLPVTYVELQVFDSNTESPLNANVKIIDNKTFDKITETKILKDGISKHALMANTNYYIQVEFSGYHYFSEHVSLDSVYKTQKPYLLRIPMQRKKLNRLDDIVTKPIILKNVFFEKGESILKKESFIEIDYLFAQLQKSPGMKIKIIGHTDNVGSDDDNLLLSESRAKAVYDALLTKGVSKSRLFYDGKGETDPIDTNDTPEGRQNNRRTEFVILED